MVDPQGYLAVLRRRLPHILVLAAVLSAMDLLRAFPIMVEMGGGLARQLAQVGTVSMQSLVDCSLVVAAITYAERTALARTHRALAMVLAVAIAAPLATAVGSGIAMTANPASTYGTDDGAALYLYLLWFSLVVGILAAAYFTIWERAQESTTHLRAAEIERQGMEQRMVESRLNVMKARVDPEFLFRMIGDVQRLYRADVDAAEDRLEDLIAYLRAALPQMRGGATTLGEEVRLAEAFVKLHEESFDGRLRSAFEVEESLEGAQFPPMALLPLVDDALRRAARAEPPRLALRVAASRSDGTLSVAVEDDCIEARHSSRGEPALESHQRAFVQFFGEDARVRREAAGAGTRVLLEVDHAVAARTAR